jgi:hypothetical protein
MRQLKNAIFLLALFRYYFIRLAELNGTKLAVQNCSFSDFANDYCCGFGTATTIFSATKLNARWFGFGGS